MSGLTASGCRRLAWSSPRSYSRGRSQSEVSSVASALSAVPTHRDAAALPADDPAHRAGRLGDTLAGLGKFHNTTRARAVLADAQNLLGDNEILLDHQVIKHMVDLDAIHTFEGTETIQALIVGRDITGISAFA